MADTGTGAMLPAYDDFTVQPQQLLDAFRQYGAVTLRDSLPKRTPREGLAAARALFADRHRLAAMPYDPEKRIGYTPPGVEGFQRDPAAKNVQRECVDLDWQNLNLPPELYWLHTHAKELGRRVLGRLDMALGSEKRRPLITLPEGRHILRLSRYLSPDTTRDTVLFEEHRDFGLLTVFIGNGQTGLQAKIGEDWVDVPLGIGDACVAAGTPLTRFEPSIRAFPHRVVGGESERISAFLFYEPDGSVELPATPAREAERFDAFLDRVLRNVRAEEASMAA